MKQVFTKANKRSPEPRPTEFAVNVIHNKKITVYKNGEECRSFELGDIAEYDSFNLRYTGQISRITEKGVQITAYPGSRNERRYNLDLYRFCWRNYDFDAAKTHAHNMNEMMYI